VNSSHSLSHYPRLSRSFNGIHLWKINSRKIANADRGS
jgi:hypothetical protein